MYSFPHSMRKNKPFPACKLLSYFFPKSFPARFITSSRSLMPCFILPAEISAFIIQRCNPLCKSLSCPVYTKSKAVYTECSNDFSSKPEVEEINAAIDMIKNRRSVRSFKDEMIPHDVLETILEAGTYAATGMNRQSPIILAVTNRKLRDRLSAMNAQILTAAGRDGSRDPFYGAPVVLVVLADKNVPTCIHDGSLVMGNLMLAASELGVGSCWIHRAKETFESEEGKAILRDLGVTGDYIGVGNCVLGYPMGDIPQAKPRKENYVYWAE